MWTPRDTKGSQGLRFPFFFLTVYYLSWDCHSVALFLIKHFWCKENIALSWYAVAEQIEKWVNGFQTDIKRKFLGRLCFIFLYRYDQVLNQPVSVFLFIHICLFFSLSHTHMRTHTHFGNNTSHLSVKEHILNLTWNCFWTMFISDVKTVSAT